MDFLPIQSTSTNKVNSMINLANDGGSKSNTGYFSNRGAKETPEETVDEVTLSTSSASSDPLETEEAKLNMEIKKFFKLIKDSLKKTKEFIFKLLGFNKIKIKNIYKEHDSETP